VSELSTDERRYLLAAFAATPLHWFRSQVVGRQADLSFREIDQLLASLVHAGLLDADSQHCARLTDLGRAAAAGFLQPHRNTPHRLLRRRWLVPACALGITVGLLGVWWLIRTL
jgi:hypothetical protein